MPPKRKRQDLTKEIENKNYEILGFGLSKDLKCSVILPSFEVHVQKAVQLFYNCVAMSYGSVMANQAMRTQTCGAATEIMSKEQEGTC